MASTNALNCLAAGGYPYRPRVCDQFSDGLRKVSLDRAGDYWHIEATPPTLITRLVFDRDLPTHPRTHDDLMLPAPTALMINPVNAHAHLFYDLEIPVIRLDDNGYQRDSKAMAYASAIEDALLMGWGADRAYPALMMKNPAHPAWRTTYTGKKYSLGELHEYLPDKLPRLPQLKESFGAGRNCQIFDNLRQWAYRNAMKATSADGFFYECHATAQHLNAQFPAPLPMGEVKSVAKSIARKVYQNRVRYHHAWLEKQSKRGKAGMISRWGDNEDKQSSARLMRVQNPSLTVRQIADELKVHYATVSRWINFVA